MRHADLLLIGLLLEFADEDEGIRETSQERSIAKTP